MFEPHPLLLAYFVVRQFVFLEAVALLALLRVLRSGGLSRLFGCVALLLALGGVAITLAPALGLATGALYDAASALMTQHLWPWFLPSGALALSAALPQRRWPWVDYLHIAALWAFVGLAVASRLV